MAKFNDQWTVGPHGPVETLDDGLLTVAGDISMPLGNFPRRMTVAALSDGRSAIWSAMPLRELEMREIEALGDPAFLIVPGIGHRLDVKPWKRRYPRAQVVCAPGAREAVAEVVPVDATGDVLEDPDVRLETVPGTADKEAALVVRRAGGTTLVVNDILANVRHPHGLGAQIMARLFGFGGRPAEGAMDGGAHVREGSHGARRGLSRLGAPAGSPAHRRQPRRGHHRIAYGGVGARRGRVRPLTALMCGSGRQPFRGPNAGDPLPRGDRVGEHANALVGHQPLCLELAQGGLDDDRNRAEAALLGADEERRKTVDHRARLQPDSGYSRRTGRRCDSARAASCS